jgi:hypothetical protein
MSGASETFQGAEGTARLHELLHSAIQRSNDNGETKHFPTMGEIEGMISSSE